ncbi:putative secreted protein [Propionispora sp. 2/2-37]|uniref:hypothetical protein n=1 Tax=Propionispora sp. 2/2-37 TaxID=1677858 RepID=UPI0006BB9531|nr:hypothetical protein [Propionispora sp. 2/2-37]CUH94204.1 putative secreted protein [Propionispora sp. 2/2-37]
MRIICLALALLLVLSSQVSAISSINLDVIKQAQAYGTSKFQADYSTFLAPWMSFEERAPKLDEFAERAYLYTPFLLIAIDARDKAGRGEKVEIEDSDKTLQDYSGYIIFSAVLFGGDATFVQGATATVKQDKKIIKVAQSTIPAEAVKTAGPGGNSLYMSQCYFYFKEKDIFMDSPGMLVVSTQDKREHRFYFNIPQIR